MNINELTIGQAKELAALFGASQSIQPAHPFVGRTLSLAATRLECMPVKS